LTKVLYDGVHVGDHLALEDLNLVAIEIALLKNERGHRMDNDELIRDFEYKMSALVEAAQRVQKPIAF